MTTYADCNTAEVDIAADTLTTVATITIPSGQGGNIKFIRFAHGNIVTTLASNSGYLQLTRGSQGGTFRFPVMSGNVDGDVGNSIGNAESIPVDIPILANEVVTISAECAGAIAGAHAGIVWEA